MKERPMSTPDDERKYELIADKLMELHELITDKEFIHKIDNPPKDGVY
jgi:hypothetical protein